MEHEERLSGNQVAFLFMDERPDRIAHLEAELERLPIPTNFTVRTATGKFETVLRAFLDKRDGAGARLPPTFAFIDPFGFKGIPFALVCRLLENPRTEVFVNVMLDAVNRFLEHPDSRTRQHIVDLFGTGKVLQVASSPGDRIERLRLLYQEQLSRAARFVRYFRMRDRHGRDIYSLFFASNHPLGHAKMKEAFWKVDPSSGFEFSDATNPSQLVLFEVDETTKLATYLEEAFEGQRVSVGRVKQHVQDHTAFVARHMRRALLLLESERRVAVDDLKSDGSKRRRNTYPEQAVVTFP